MKSKLSVLVSMVSFFLLISTFSSHVYASTCASTSNSDYDITVCLDAPSSNPATLSGNTAVTGSFNSFTAKTSGTRFSRLEFAYTPAGGSEVYLNSNFGVSSGAASSFTWHTNHFVDTTSGTLSVRAILTLPSGSSNSDSSNSASQTITLNNSVTTAPVNTNTYTPVTPNPSGDLTLAIVGDGASNESTPINVANMMSGWNPQMSLYLADVYYKGSYEEFQNWYEGSFGVLKSVTNPVVGNHEYLADSGGQTASGYMWYWNNVPNYYSYDAKGWHFIALNTNYSKILSSNSNTNGTFDNSGPSGVGRITDTTKNWRTNQWVNQTVTVGTQTLYISSNTATQLVLSAAWTSVPSNNTAYSINGGSATELAWLDADLAANADKCIVAYAHHPRWSIGSHGSDTAYDTLWNKLVDNKVTLYMVGHDHSYQRWTAMSSGPNGDASATGVVQFLVGGGGHGSTSISGSDSRVLSSIGGSAGYGALKLTLNKNKATFEYRKVSDQSVFDSGSIWCKGQGTLSGQITDSVSSAAVSGVTVAYSGTAPQGTVTDSTTTDSSGNYSFTDIPAVDYTVTATKTGYANQSESDVSVGGATTTTQDFVMDSTVGTVSGTVTDAGTTGDVSGVTVSYSGGTTTTDSNGDYSLTNVTAGIYKFTASKSGYDTKEASVTITAGQTATQNFSMPQIYFSDDFEAGNMNSWTTNNNLTAQQTVKNIGSWATEGNATGSSAMNARKTLSSTYSNLFLRTYFHVNSQASGSGLGLLAYRTSADAAIMKLYIDGTTNKLCIRNEVTLTNICSNTVPSQDTWHSAELHTIINGTSSTHEVWFNGTQITDLTSTAANLGTTNIGRVVIGEVNSGRTYDVFFDDVKVGNAYIGKIVGTIGGTITDSLSSEDVGGVAVSYSGGSTTSNSDGSYALVNAPLGTVSVSASKTGYTTQNSNVTVDTNGTVTKDFSLVPTTGRISGTITDTSNAALSGATVSYSGGNATTDGSGAYLLTAVEPGTYTVTASKTGYTSKSTFATVTGGAVTTKNLTLPTQIFSDNFESGNLSSWNSGATLTAQQTTTHFGSWAVEGNTTNGATVAKKTLGSTYPEAYYRTYFQVKSQASGSNISLIAFRSASDSAIVKMYIDGTTNKICLRNEITSTNTCSTTVPTQNAWHSLELHAIINGTSSTHEVWYDGTQVNDLTSTSANLSTNNIGRLWLGEGTSGRTYDVVFDDVLVQTSRVAQEGGSITGQITDSQSSAALSGATVSIPGKSTTSDGSGNFTLADVAPGTYTVTASKNGYTDQNASVSVISDTASTKNFALVGSNIGSITGTVTDAGTSAALSGVTVSYSGGNVTTDGSGVYTLSGVVADTYTLTASKTGYTTKTASVTVTSGQSSSQNFALPLEIFTDTFETGDFSKWTSNTGMTAQQTTVHGGSWAAEGNTTNGATYLKKTLGSSYSNAYYRAYFFVKSQATGSNSALIWFRDTNDVAIVKLYIDGNTNKLCLRNEIAASNVCSNTAPTQNAWHSVEMRAIINGTSSTHDVWYDGTVDTALASTTANLGSTNIGRLQLGESATGRTYDVVFDDVLVQNVQVGQ